MQIFDMSLQVINNLRIYFSKIYLTYEVLFFLIATGFLACQIFPSLYGDEYGSLLEADSILSNPQAVGYFLQLHYWKQITGGDLGLRLLSVLWGGVAIFACRQWAAALALPKNLSKLWILLLITNAFFIQYATQIRFYSMFLAGSLLFFWRLTAWGQQRSLQNSFYLAASAAILLVSHLFGWIVLGAGGIALLWERLSRRGRLFLVFAGAVGGILLFTPAIRDFFIKVVYRFTAVHDHPQFISRGLSLAMFSKIPSTAFFFTFGEHVYPFQWLIAPLAIITCIAFFAGLLRLKDFPRLAVFTTFIFLTIVAVYLVLDPLAPPSLQGAAPRYVIYALPPFLLVCLLAVYRNRFLCLLLFAVNWTGLLSFFMSSWSYGQSDLMNWPKMLNEAIANPSKTCVISDGRAWAPLQRYLPKEVTLTKDPAMCNTYTEVLVVSNDYRLDAVRYLDAVSAGFGEEYRLVKNYTKFPAQITIYEKSKNEKTEMAPARLDLPEQDLEFPITASKHGWSLNGFVRLDEKTPDYFFQTKSEGVYYLIANYRSSETVPKGTPTLLLESIDPDGNLQRKTLKAGADVGSWDDKSCEQCEEIAAWFKRIHLVGKFGYPQAYKQFKARVWAVKIGELKAGMDFRVTSKIKKGTIYFYGLFPATDAAIND